MQTKLQITVNWKELKIKLKEKYPNLNDEDLNFLAGKEDELVTRLALKLAKTEEEITDVIDELQLKTLKTEKTLVKERGESHDAERRETENRDAERREKESQKEEF